MKSRNGFWRPAVGVATLSALAFGVTVYGSPRTEGTRDKGSDRSQASRLVTGNGDHLTRVVNEGGIAAGAFTRWQPVHDIDGSLGGQTAGSNYAPSDISGTTVTIRNTPARVWLEVRYGGWGAGLLKNQQAVLDDIGLLAGDLFHAVEPCAVNADCVAAFGPGSGCTAANHGYINGLHGPGHCGPGMRHAGRADDIPPANGGPYNLQPTDFSGPAYRWANTILADAPKTDPGFAVYTGTLVLDVPLSASGSYTVGFIPKPSTIMQDETDTDYIVKLEDATVIIPIGQCCNQDLVCTDDTLTKSQCEAQGGLWSEGKTCADACACTSNADCNDGDACTQNVCNLASGQCSNPLIPGFNPAVSCCNPANGSLTAIDDGDQCTEDTCSLPNSRGVAVNTVVEGLSCDDGNDCTYADACTADGDCEGLDVNAAACLDSADCEAETGAGFDCIDGFCFCTLVPDLNFVVTPGEIDKKDPNDGTVCFNEGEKVSVAVRVGAAAAVINGGQFVINYDNTCLQFVSIQPGGDPYTQEIQRDVNQAAGTIFYAVGVELGGVGVQGNANLAILSFNKIGGCSDCDLCFGGINPVNTYLVDSNGQQVPVAPKCSKEIRTAGNLTLDTPDNIKVNVDCNKATAQVPWSVSASDTCGGVDLVCEGSHQSGFVFNQNVVNNGGEIPRGNSTFCCSATNDCNAEAENCWTVTVNDETTLDVSLQLSPTMATKPFDPLVRCLKFEVFNNCVQAPLVFETDVTFGGLFDLVGKFTDSIKIPGAVQPACITVRDQLHTLRSCYLFAPGGGDCVNGVLSANFTGDPFFGGNWLIGGNLDGWKKSNPNASHDVIDILDFGMFVSQYLSSYDSNGDGEADGNTPCGTAGPHADINGDGVVDALDFTFVSLNFLAESKDCCCPGSAALNNVPRTEVTVKELREMGMSSLTVADLNGDGVVNLEDMMLFMQGEVPSRKAPARDRNGSVPGSLGSN